MQTGCRCNAGGCRLEQLQQPPPHSLPHGGSPFLTNLRRASEVLEDRPWQRIGRASRPPCTASTNPTAALHVAGGSTCTNRARIPVEHRAAGLSWAKVADKLNATGHRTRTGGPVDTARRPPGAPGPGTGRRVTRPGRARRAAQGRSRQQPGRSGRGFVSLSQPLTPARVTVDQPTTSLRSASVRSVSLKLAEPR